MVRVFAAGLVVQFDPVVVIEPRIEGRGDLDEPLVAMEDHHLAPTIWVET